LPGRSQAAGDAASYERLRQPRASPDNGYSDGPKARRNADGNPSLRHSRPFVAQTEFTVPRPSPGPGQERPDAGRSPGSWVIAWYTAFPGLAWFSVRPSGCRIGAPAVRTCISRSPLTVAGTAAELDLR